MQYHLQPVDLTLACLASVLYSSLISIDAPAAEGLPAFPGAEGFGACTPGGRGGKVIFVTNLEDYVPGREEAIEGSLRAACETKGPRIVVFRVSGTIALKAGLRIREPYITLAGQTAPGGGICVKDHHVLVGANDVVVRFMCFRPGDEPVAAYQKRGKSFEPDALSVVAGARNVVIDHCSTMPQDEGGVLRGARGHGQRDGGVPGSLGLLRRKPARTRCGGYAHHG